jgi:hypothetical protein
MARKKVSAPFLRNLNFDIAETDPSVAKAGFGAIERRPKGLLHPVSGNSLNANALPRTMKRGIIFSDHVQ